MINHFLKLIFFFISSNLLKKHKIGLNKCQQDLISAQHVSTRILFIGIVLLTTNQQYCITRALTKSSDL